MAQYPTYGGGPSGKKNAKIYLKYIYLKNTFCILQIHLYIYVHNKNTLMQFYFWYTKLVQLKSAKLEQPILYLRHFNCAEVVLKSN